MATASGLWGVAGRRAACQGYEVAGPEAVVWGPEPFGLEQGEPVSAALATPARLTVLFHPEVDACWIEEASPAVGVHAGSGALMVGLQPWHAPERYEYQDNSPSRHENEDSLPEPSEQREADA